MVFNLYEEVRIVNKNVIGHIVDIYNERGQTVYTIQSSKPGCVDDPDAYPGEYPLYDCTEDQLELI